MKTNFLWRVAFISCFLLVFMFVFPCVAQGFGADPEMVKKIGEAAGSSNANYLGYLLAFITVSSLGFAAHAQNMRDKTIEKIDELTKSINNQTSAYLANTIKDDTEVKDLLNRTTAAIEKISERPCALPDTYKFQIVKK